MGKGIIQRLMEKAELSEVPLPGHPILELAGDRRVLIENHFGVKEYSQNRITVKVSYGQVSIQGESLRILRMTNKQLLICGSISGIALQRREKP